MAKKAPAQVVTGESGVHLIARIVDEMRHIWHPAVGPDSGIDGQIELRDPSAGGRPKRSDRSPEQSHDRKVGP